MDVNDINEEEKKLITQSFLFKDVPAEIINEALLSDECEVHVFDKNESVYSKEKFSKSIGLVLKGSLSVQKNSKNHCLSMNRISCGNFFGAAAVFCDNEDYVTLLKAVEKTKAVFFTENLLRELMQKSFEAAENYIRFLTGRIRFLNDKIDHLGAGGTERMLGRYLLNNSAVTENGCITHLPCSFSELSQLLGIGRASLYRSLDALENEGIIKRNGKNIELINIKKLEEL